ncbi:hypothetical protein SASPL_117819 [Salvia splendens]|uniref:Multidrug resistance protein, MATE family n=1 Tax=Salvia splendens TaxID=180675 RepID=A0A8X8XYM5_SALSN|nr:hypothetical protein SASPL_117819 [Salvia splendens]
MPSYTPSSSDYLAAFGVYLQQSCIISLVVTALMTPLFVFAAPILKALGQDHSIADMAGKYAPWFVAVAFLYTVMYSCNAFLQSQSKNFVIVYIMRGGCQETWRGFTASAFKDLGQTTRLVISSGVMICTILTPLAGNMGNAEVTIDALSICLNISGWAMMVSVGFMASTSVRVSNELGRRDAKAEKLSIMVAVGTSFSIGLVLCVFFVVFRENAAYLFTNDEEVAKAVARLSPLLVLLLLLNSVQPVLSGEPSLLSKQIQMIKPVALYNRREDNLLCRFCQWNRAARHSGGVWIGIISGTAVQTAILVLMTCMADLNKQILINFIFPILFSCNISSLQIFLAQKRICPPAEDETTHYSTNNGKR